MASPLCRGSAVLLTSFLAINEVCERACFDHAPLQPTIARGAPSRGTRTTTDRATPKRCVIHRSACVRTGGCFSSAFRQSFCRLTEPLPCGRCVHPTTEARWLRLTPSPIAAPATTSSSCLEECFSFLRNDWRRYAAGLTDAVLSSDTFIPEVESSERAWLGSKELPGNAPAKG